MARARSPSRDKAREMYLKAEGDIKLLDIAKELGVLDTQIRKWKFQDKWDSEQMEVNIKNIKKERTIENINKVKKIKNKKDSIYFEMITTLRIIINDEASTNTEKIEACNSIIKLSSIPGLAKKLNAVTRMMGFKGDNAITEDEWNKSIDYFKNNKAEQCCAYCGKHFKELEKEHIKALSNGGKATKGNIIPACRIGNTTKNNRDFIEWYLGSLVYSEERMNKIFEYIEEWGDS